MSYELICTGVIQGLVVALIALGVMIPLRFLHFSDLTAEGAYPFGGVVCASLLVLGVPPLPATLAAGLATGILGMGTAFVHLRLRVHPMLAGILLSTMMYSVNLRVLGRPNLPLFTQESLFAIDHLLSKVVTLLGIVGLVLLPLWLFLKTDTGLRLRAVGQNPTFAARQSISVVQYTYLGLFAGNLCTGLAGGLMVQLQRYAEVGMGVGMAVQALAALMLGETLLGGNSMIRQLCAPVLGALVYQQMQGLALSIGLAPSDLKLLTGGTLLAVLALRRKDTTAGSM